MRSENWTKVWQRSRENWHWPLLPLPVLGQPDKSGSFPFQNYQITLDNETLNQGPIYLENLFDHLIVHYVFCPRSLEEAGYLALAALKGLFWQNKQDNLDKRDKDIERARRAVNIFSDIVVDSFRLERSQDDEKKVLLGWKRLERQRLMPLDRLILGFFREYWGAPLPSFSCPEVDDLLRVFSPGVRDKSLWPRQCQETARILGGFVPGILGKGPIRTLEILNGSADAVPLLSAASLDADGFEEALAVLGLKGDLKRWYRDQSYSIEIRQFPGFRTEANPSGYTRWRLTDPCYELDVSYSLSMSPYLIPGVSTYKRDHETSPMLPGREKVPDLLVVLDSSRSMEGPKKGTKTHKATLAAFKACQFAHSMGAEIAAINFSERYLAVDWTRDLNRVEDVLVEFICSRTQIPGKRIRELAEARPDCLILCITDTHIQNLYQEWEDIKRASEVGRFVLFSIDPDYKDKHVEASLSALGQVYYIRRLEDLISLVVEVSERAYGGESFISS